MVSQNILLPTQEQLATFLDEERWEFQPKGLCVEEVLWKTAQWITFKFPPIVSPEFASTLLEHLEPYFQEWETAKFKVSTPSVMH
jgi:hypothetical protein